MSITKKFGLYEIIFAAVAAVNAVIIFLQTVPSVFNFIKLFFKYSFKFAWDVTSISGIVSSVLWIVLLLAAAGVMMLGKKKISGGIVAGYAVVRVLGEMIYLIDNIVDYAKYHEYYSFGFFTAVRWYVFPIFSAIGFLLVTAVLVWALIAKKATVIRPAAAAVLAAVPALLAIINVIAVKGIVSLAFIGTFFASICLILVPAACILCLENDRDSDFLKNIIPASNKPAAPQPVQNAQPAVDLTKPEE